MENKSLQFAFLGTPDVASMTLDILYTNGYIPKVIITSPDKKSGRGLHLTETPVAIWAKEHNVECLKPEKITPEFIEDLRNYLCDLFIVVAYGKILPQTLIDLPSLGTINIHYSLLPKYRGASPLEQALLSGDTETGVSIQQMAFKLDSGPIIAEQSIPIGIEDTKEKLRMQLIKTGGDVLVKILPDIIAKTTRPKVQDESRATHCTKIKKEDGEIDLADNPNTNYNKYRAYYGWPGTYFFIEHNGKKLRIKITQASYKNDSFIIERVIPEGKKEMPYQDFLRGFKII